MNTLWKVFSIQSMPSAIEVLLHCDTIMSRNSNCHNNFILSQVLTAPASPTGATLVYSNATYLYGVLSRGDYIYFFGLSEGVHRYNTVTYEDEWMSSGIGTDTYYSKAFTVLDNDTVVVITSGADGYKHFEKQNLVTQERTTIVSNFGYGQICWHWRIVDNKLVFMLINDNPGGGKRSHDVYVYDVDGGGQLYSNIGSVEGADAFLQYQVCQSVVVGTDVFFEYHTGLSDYNGYEETVHIIRVSLSSYGVTVYRPEYNGNDIYVFHMTYNPYDSKIYFIGYAYYPSQIRLVGRLTPSGGAVEWVYTTSGLFSNFAQWPRALTPSASNVYMVKCNGEVYNVLNTTVVLATIASITTSSPYPPDFPQPIDLGNIVDNNNYIWYIENDDVKAKDLDDGSLVVNLDTNLPAYSGTYGIRQMFISNGKIFTLTSSRPGTNYIYKVT